MMKVGGPNTQNPTCWLTAKIQMWMCETCSKNSDHGETYTQEAHSLGLVPPELPGAMQDPASVLSRTP